MKAFTRDVPMMGKEHYVRFGGVVGDFNPVHYDLDFAKKLRLPAVISQGPLSFALALDAAGAEAGFDGLSKFSARIAAPVFPDTPMTVTCDEEGNLTMAGKADGTTYLSGTIESKANG